MTNSGSFGQTVELKPDKSVPVGQSKGYCFCCYLSAQLLPCSGHHCVLVLELAGSILLVIAFDHERLGCLMWSRYPEYCTLAWRAILPIPEYTNCLGVRQGALSPLSFLEVLPLLR